MRRGRGAGSSNRVETSQLQEERIVGTETLYVIKNIFLSFIDDQEYAKDISKTKSRSV